MRLTLLSLLALLVVPAFAHAEEAPKFKLIHVADLVRLQQASPRLVLLDANHEEFREKNGIIPGAKLLSSFRSYDVAKELPADKTTPLVFYCASRL
jgi:hypothetical protein